MNDPSMLEKAAFDKAETASYSSEFFEELRRIKVLLSSTGGTVAPQLITSFQLRYVLDDLMTAVATGKMVGFGIAHIGSLFVVAPQPL
jgi:hypothetical protein